MATKTEAQKRQEREQRIANARRNMARTGRPVMGYTRWCPKCQGARTLERQHLRWLLGREYDCPRCAGRGTVVTGTRRALNAWQEHRIIERYRWWRDAHTTRPRPGMFR